MLIVEAFKLIKNGQEHTLYVQPWMLRMSSFEFIEGKLLEITSGCEDPGMLFGQAH